MKLCVDNTVLLLAPVDSRAVRSDQQGVLTVENGTSSTPRFRRQMPLTQAPYGLPRGDTPAATMYPRESSVVPVPLEAADECRASLWQIRLRVAPRTAEHCHYLRNRRGLTRNPSGLAICVFDYRMMGPIIAERCFWSRECNRFQKMALLNITNPTTPLRNP
jgi:hypothetical protein